MTYEDISSVSSCFGVMGTLTDDRLCNLEENVLSASLGLDIAFFMDKIWRIICHIVEGTLGGK